MHTYLGQSNLINHLALTTIGNNVLFTNKKAPINDCLPPCHNAAGHGPRGIKTDVCCAISIQIPAVQSIYEL